MKQRFAAQVTLVAGGILTAAPLFGLLAVAYTILDPQVRPWLGHASLGLADLAVVYGNAGVWYMLPGALLLVIGYVWLRQHDGRPEAAEERASRALPNALLALGIFLAGVPVLQFFAQGVRSHRVGDLITTQFDVHGLVLAAQGGVFRYALLFFAAGVLWRWVIGRRERLGYVVISPAVFTEGERMALARVFHTVGLACFIAPVVAYFLSFIIVIFQHRFDLQEEEAKQIASYVKFWGVGLLIPGMMLISASTVLFRVTQNAAAPVRLSDPAEIRIANFARIVCLGLGGLLLIGSATDFLIGLLHSMEGIPAVGPTPFERIDVGSGPYVLLLIGITCSWICRRHDRLGYVFFSSTNEGVRFKLRLAKTMIVAIGLLSVAVGVAGILYNGASVYGIVHAEAMETPPYFGWVYGVMISLSSVCCVLLTLCGVQFVGLRTRYIEMFTGVVVAEVVLFLAASLLWLAQVIGHSVAAATGVSLGGFALQFATLFPLWAPPILLWAWRQVTQYVDLAEPNDEAQSLPVVAAI